MTHTLGYAIEKEDRKSLEENGEDCDLLLSRFKGNYPDFNSKASNHDAVFNIINQGSIGACQGASLSKCFQICYYLKTGRVLNFSAMCAYILSQKYDGLLGRDVGSTLSGGQQAAKEGICLEDLWRYPSRYSSQILSQNRDFKMTSSKPTNDPDLILDALFSGLPVQTGVAWNDELEQELVTRYTGRGARGGHATTLWLMSDSDESYQHNSWGTLWAGDGRNRWTMDALTQIVRYPGNTFVIYSPDGLTNPELEAI